MSAHLKVRDDADWMSDLVGGTMHESDNAMLILKSILPEFIIDRMQAGYNIIGDSHPHVVILFSDVVGFSTMSSTMPAAEVGKNSAC